MTISQLIEALQKIEDSHGDLYVEHSTGHLVQGAAPVSVDGEGKPVAVRLS